MKKGLLIITCLLLFVISCKEQSKTEKDIKTEKTVSSKYACVPQITDADWYKKDNVAPLFNGFDAINYPITTKSDLVQRYFNQGMVLAYGFNHAEAARSFYYATKLRSRVCHGIFWICLCSWS